MHPHTYVARTAFAELLALPGAPATVAPLLPRLLPPLRAALVSPDASVVATALLAIQQVSACVGEALTPCVTPLLVQINKHDTNRALRDAVRATLEALEVNGGPQAGALLRAKLPSYGR